MVDSRLKVHWVTSDTTCIYNRLRYILYTTHTICNSSDVYHARLWRIVLLYISYSYGVWMCVRLVQVRLVYVRLVYVAYLVVTIIG